MPVPPHASAAAPGIHRLALGGGRDALLHVPPVWKPGQPAALAVMLHGSGGEPQQGLSLLQPYGEDAGVIVLAPASHAYTWDALLNGFGRDVETIDRALQFVFDRYVVDMRRLAIGGFSDGASYGLTLALSNGDLFTQAIALSPGFVAKAPLVGRPAVFVSHGTSDRVLPIDPCSRRIVPALRELGLAVEYVEFDGGHVIPPAVAKAAVGQLIH